MTPNKPKTLLWRMSQWAPFRLISYAAAIMAVAIIAKILTLLLVPPLPSPVHEPLTLIRNCLLHDEAALVLGVPAGTVKTNMSRGKAKLRESLRAWNPVANG